MRALVCFVLLALFPGPPVLAVRAAEFAWIATGDANFAIADNWAPSATAPPGSNDVALFNRGVTTPTTVLFQGDVTNKQLMIASDNLSFEFAGYTYQVNSIGSPAASLVVGSGGGTARLQLRDGTIATLGVIVGMDPGSTGHISLYGTDWTWQSQTQLGITIGHEGSGIIELSDGATLRTDWMRLAWLTQSSQGDLLLGGAGTAVDITRFFEVGANGAGTVAIHDGARLSAQGIAVGALRVATPSRIDVYGDGSRLTSQTLDIGFQGNAHVSFVDGAEVTTNRVSLAGGIFAERSTTTIHSARWTIADNLEIGGTVNAGGSARIGGVAELHIESLGHVIVGGSARLWNRSELQVAGGTLVANEYTQLGTLDVTLDASDTTYIPIDVSTTANLGGTLRVAVDDPVSVAPGASYALIRYGNRIGVFQDVVLPDAPSSSLVWQLDYSPASVNLTLKFVPLAGDANLDGVVDHRDIAIVVANYGHSFSTWESGDFDGDGRTTVLDLMQLKQRLGEGSTRQASALESAVPEPSSLGYAFGTMGVLLFWRRHSRRLLATS